LGTAKE